MAIVFDAQGNLVDTEGRINFASEGSDVLPPNPFLSPGTADDPYANLIGLPATQDMGFLYGVPQRADDQGYFIGLPGTADDVFPFEPPGTADDRIANLISLPGTADDVFPFAPKNRLGGLDLNRFEGIGTLGVANQEDVEQVDYIGSKPNRFKEGIAKLFEFFQRISPLAAVGRGLESLRNRFETRKAIERNIRSDPQGGPITTFRNVKQQAQDKIDDRGRGQIPSRAPTSTTSRRDTSPSSSYSQASYARRR